MKPHNGLETGFRVSIQAHVVVNMLHNTSRGRQARGGGRICQITIARERRMVLKMNRSGAQFFFLEDGCFHSSRNRFSTMVKKSKHVLFSTGACRVVLFCFLGATMGKQLLEGELSSLSVSANTNQGTLKHGTSTTVPFFCYQ